MKVKLVNLNIEHGGKLWNNVVSFLRAEDPDLLFLQEVYNADSGPEPRFTTVKSLQRLFDYPYTAFETQFIMHNGNDVAPFGCAMLSKLPLLDKAVLWLKGDRPVDAFNEDRESIPNLPRNLLHCRVSIKGQDYNLMTLQGVWAPDGNVLPAQEAMALRIVDYIKGKDNIILSGDFNVNEGTAPINLISEQLVNIFAGERVSSFNMKYKTNPGYASAVVDFVFTSPGVKVLEHRTAEADVSDHQSQIVVFDL